jgi:uncharacterized protein GlcG (DUF336 family)
MDTPKESVQREEIMATETTAASPSFPSVHTRPCDANFFSPVRMDDVWIGSIDISINKAYTTRASDISTKDLAQYLQSGGHFFGIHVSNHGRVMVFAGGIPLTRGGKVVGGVGVSGGSGEQDHAVAEAGAKAF